MTNHMVNVEIALKAIEIAYWNEDLKEAIQLIKDNMILLNNDNTTVEA